MIGLLFVLLISSHPLIATPIEITNNYVKLVLDTDGTVTSLHYDQDPDNIPEQLHPLRTGKIPLADLFTVDPANLSEKITTGSTQIEPIGGDHYRLRFGTLPTLLILSIVPGDGFFTITLENLENPPPHLDSIQFYQFVPHHILQSPMDPHREWVDNATPDTLFIHSLPLNVNTVCHYGPISPVQGIRGTAYRGMTTRMLEFDDGHLFIGARGVLVTAPQREYLATLRKIILQYDLPYSEHGGQWFRESNDSRESYFFTSVSDTEGDATHYENIISLIKRNGMRQILIHHPFVLGSYTQPMNFSSREAFFKAIERFEEEGILVAIHTFMNRIQHQDSFYNPENPTENLFHVSVGELAEDIPPDVSTIPLKKTQDTLTNFHHYVDRFRLVPIYGIGQELIHCKAYDDDPSEDVITLEDCSRGHFGSTESIHPQGRTVHLVPYQSGSFFVNPDNPDIVKKATDAFAEFFNEVEPTFIYTDGGHFFPTPGMDTNVAHYYLEKVGVLPYISKLNYVPTLQHGNHQSFNWPYYHRSASNDGGEFKPKEYTREYKVDLLRKYSGLYRDTVKEIGWWKILGASLSSGQWDIWATTVDDVHYAMTKVAAFDTSMGLQMGFNWSQNKLLTSLLDLFHLYMALLNEDQSGSIIPLHIKNYLQNPDTEAELNKVNGYNLVEKKVFQKTLSWSDQGMAFFDFDNPFQKQKLKLEIRPVFDPYPLTDPRHILIDDFTDNTRWSIEEEKDAACEWQGPGVLKVTPTENRVGSCAISLAPPLGKTFWDLSHHRGLGLALFGDGKEELVLAHLHTESVGVRDYKIHVDFNGRKEFVLAEAVTKDSDLFINDGGDSLRITAPANMKFRSWRFDYSKTKVSIYVFVKPGDTYSLQFHQLQALREKDGGSRLIVPRIDVNGQSLSFPITLAANDEDANILEYNGYAGEYKVFNSNYDLLGTRKIDADQIVVKHGINTFQMTSFTNDPNASRRSEIRLSVYDDEDNDGIPTHGSYLTTFSPRDPENGRIHFYDDDNPFLFNPEQNGSGEISAPPLHDGFLKFPNVFYLHKSDRFAIRYSLSENNDITLTLYDRMGNHIRVLDKGPKDISLSPFEPIWDGRNESGEKVASGIYILLLKTDKTTHRKKIVVIK
jgi:hypothetical protein